MMHGEMAAAKTAQETGMYGVWRSPGKDFCARIGPSTRCFCGHSYTEHHWKSMKDLAPKCGNCVCKRFQYVPSRPEEAGEYWLPRRRGFDVNLWRAKCRCKYDHEQHDPNHLSCAKGKCGSYESAWECVGCDRKWQEHETVFEDEQERIAAGLPVGAAFEPLAENPELLNMVFERESTHALPFRPTPERAVVLSGHTKKTQPPSGIAGKGGTRALRSGKNGHGDSQHGRKSDAVGPDRPIGVTPVTRAANLAKRMATLEIWEPKKN